MPESRSTIFEIEHGQKIQFHEKTFVDYPQEPKVCPGERIPTIPDDSVPENQNQPEFKMPDYKKIMASFERYCKNKVVEADKFVEDHQASQSMPSILLNEGKDMIPRLEELFSKMERRWEDIMDKFEGADYDELEKRVTDMRSKVKKCKEKLTQFLERFDEEEDLDEESDEEDLDEEFWLLKLAKESDQWPKVSTRNMTEYDLSGPVGEVIDS